MPILVTGGAGFIGSHFIERLLAESDEEVVCLDDFNDYYDPHRKRENARAFAGRPRVSLIEGSFCDEALVADVFARHGIDRIVHLGAYAGVRASIERPLIYQQVNVVGTAVLLEAARRHAARRFLLASSSTVYGQGATVPFQEDAPLGIPLSPYGASKRAAELLGLTYWVLHGLSVVCLRLFSVYGPRLRPDLAMSIFTQAILDGRPLTVFGDGSIQRDFTHVSDITAGLWAALWADGISGEIINLGASHPIEIRRLIELLEDACSSRACIQQQPEKPGEMPTTCADLGKADRLLGWRPTVALDAGVRDYVRWHRVACPPDRVTD
jgi:UDP-glucuronate 4-epimerase